MTSKSRLGSGGYGIRRLGSFAGKTTDAGIVADTVVATQTRSSRIGAIKKPGVPGGTPDWLKTMIETMTGRRGNAITPPAEQTLTFSATPTKAECEALYSYVSDIRSTLAALLTRFDS
jgi:hypothetical protein